eukprot:699543-Prymnesium_polylepis.1
MGANHPAKRLRVRSCKRASAARAAVTSLVETKGTRYAMACMRKCFGTRESVSLSRWMACKVTSASRHVANAHVTDPWPMADAVARGGIGSLRAPC